MKADIGVKRRGTCLSGINTNLVPIGKLFNSHQIERGETIRGRQDHLIHHKQ